MFAVAGEFADGIVAHPFSTPEYLRDVGMPALAKGLARANRAPSQIEVSCPVFTLVESSPTLAADEAYVRQQLAFYASTPTYRAVLAHHGWSETGEKLSDLARRGRFDELPQLVSDAMLDAFVTRAGSHEELGHRLAQRYGGILDRVGLYGDATQIDPAAVSAMAQVLGVA